MSGICAACSTTVGECPNCGTFWFKAWPGKYYGIRPVAQNPLPSLVVNGRTVPQAYSLNRWPNVVGPVSASGENYEKPYY
jgi:hypothetical protein